MGGGTFILGVLVFFFLLWAFAGGPSRPISFAGPFITPITNEGETQTGYGPPIKIGGTITLPGAALTATERPAAPTTVTNTIAAPFSSRGVSITHLADTAANPTGYIQISVSSTVGQDIDISGWSLTGTALKASSQIPTGVLLMKLGTANTLQEILLRPGDKAVVAPGESPANSSFQANKCSGYLTGVQSSYNACVTAHEHEGGFLLGTWYVYLGRTTALWKSSADTVSLVDGSGKLVASYSY